LACTWFSFSDWFAKKIRILRRKLKTLNSDARLNSSKIYLQN
jgi:hypothetical protein